ncbi:hypothetical protein X801_09851 [Opisthorchis viverrini]|uniref:G domain-containing protein n=1 Tax=Opisthorchis viverrini TaxID=6198 RepID=A0A1S8WIT1_OPIVI|nr:hypothetical protein X801_09851 [Opisthorchis viverrini]
MFSCVNRRSLFAIRLCSTSLKPYTKDQVKLKQTLKARPRPVRNGLTCLPVTVAKYLALNYEGQLGTDHCRDVSYPATHPADNDFRETPPAFPQFSSTPAALMRAYNDSDQTMPPLASTCSGCGSTLHCKTAGEPGFIPSAAYKRLHVIENRKSSRRGYARSPSSVICVRCTVLQNHLHALQVSWHIVSFSRKTSFSASTYEGPVLSHLRKDPDAAILLVADMLNLPHSLIPGLGQELGKRRYVFVLFCNHTSSYILVGNKVDELPIDQKNYLERWKQALIHAAHERSHIEEDSIVHVSLTSALTGYGINQLIDFLLSRKFNCAAPIYILGSTNVGKSSIFNRLLLSDVCKSEARETIHRATISDWPGTTAGLLKFPLVLMNSAKRGLREEAKYNTRHLTPDTKESEYVASCGFRYLKAQPIVTSDQRSYTPLADAAEKARSASPNLLSIPTYTRSCGVMEASEVDFTRLQQIYLPKGIQIDTGSWAGDRGYRLLTTFLDPRHFNDRAWCFDTPGFICPDQTLNYLSNKDLQAVSELNSNSAHSKRKAKNEADGSQRALIVPRTFIMRPGLALLLGNLGRLDLLQSPGPVYFTTFSTLPVHIVEQTEFEQYVTEHAASLGPGHEVSDGGPCGHLPPLKSRVLDPVSPQISAKMSSVDVVLSGAGWISVVGISTRNGSTSDEEELEAAESHSSSGQIHLCAWTPGGLGISVRKPPLVPNAVNRRGKRLLFMREFGGDAS